MSSTSLGSKRIPKDSRASFNDNNEADVFGSSANELAQKAALARMNAKRKSVMSPNSTILLGSANPSERALETTLASTSKALAMYKDRLSNLVTLNSDLQKQCQEQEKDALDVMGALRDQVDAKEREVVALHTLIDQNRFNYEERQKLIDLQHHKSMEDAQATIVDKESTIRLMESEVAVVKDFKRKRTELLKEIDALKTEQVEMERRFKETMVRMERKFFEEKVRMQKETNRRISEVASRAHKEAVAALDDTTKEMFRENVRLVEALKSHMTAFEEVSKQNSKLLAEKSKHSEERELNNLIVREKIVASKGQGQRVRELEAQVATLEQTLSLVVQEFDVERQIMNNKARKELEVIKRVAAQLKLNVDRKSQEMQYIKRLANHVLLQRTELETFFVDSLSLVRKQIAAEKQRGSSQDASEQSKHPKVPKKTGEQLDISDFSWEDRERVLRVLFARMNGLIREEERKASRPTTQEHHIEIISNVDGMHSSIPTDMQKEQVDLQRDNESSSNLETNRDENVYNAGRSSPTRFHPAPEIIVPSLQ